MLWECLFLSLFQTVLEFTFPMLPSYRSGNNWFWSEDGPIFLYQGWPMIVLVAVMESDYLLLGYNYDKDSFDPVQLLTKDIFLMFRSKPHAILNGEVDTHPVYGTVADHHTEEDVEEELGWNITERVKLIAMDFVRGFWWEERRVEMRKRAVHEKIAWRWIFPAVLTHRRGS